jgi:hypothetical protein
VVGQGDSPHHALPARLFSVVTLLADPPRPSLPALQVSAAAWYPQAAPDLQPTPSPAGATPALVRAGFAHVTAFTEPAKLRPALREGIAYALCHAA